MESEHEKHIAELKKQLAESMLMAEKHDAELDDRINAIERKAMGNPAMLIEAELETMKLVLDLRLEAEEIKKKLAKLNAGMSMSKALHATWRETRRADMTVFL